MFCDKQMQKTINLQKYNVLRAHPARSHHQSKGWSADVTLVKVTWNSLNIIIFIQNVETAALFLLSKVKKLI